MSKAVLVMDMPERCEWCIFHDSEHNCVYCNKGIPFADVKPDWCPLRELPERHSGDFGVIRNKEEYIKIGENIGWNACLNAIMGGEDGE